MRNPVETQKLKFDGTAKPSWHGDLVDAVGDRWLVVFFERPAYAIRGGGGGDAGLPARITGRVIEFTDLDLDVMVNPNGSYYVRDLEDFDARSTAMGYSDDARQAAWKGIALALLLVTRKRFRCVGRGGS